MVALRVLADCKHLDVSNSAHKFEYFIAVLVCHESSKVSFGVGAAGLARRVVVVL